MSNQQETPTQSDNQSVMLWLILIVLIGFIAFIVVTIVNDNKSRQAPYIPSSSSTDWKAYCRDMFPDSPSARQGCENGATATDKLMNGKYDKY